MRDMSTNRTICWAALVAIFATAGCTGPTGTGQEMRKVAHARFNRVGAAVSNDQALQALNAGQFQDALSHIDKVLAKFPDEASAHLLRGRIVLEMGRLEISMTEFQRAAELDPSCDECRYYEGVVYQRWGRDSEASQAYAAALAIAPNNTHYLLANAESLVALGKVSEAKELIDETACRFEFNSALAHLRSEIAMAEGDTDAALKNMELAVTLASDPTVYHEDLVIVAFVAGKWDRCLHALEALPPAAQERQEIVRIRARCLSMTGRAIEGRDYLVAQEKAITDRGELIPAEHDVTLGYISAMAGDWPRVDGCARRLIGRAPQLSDGYILKGMALEANGDLEGAIQFLKKAGALDPFRKMPRELLARAEAAHLAMDSAVAARNAR